MIKIEIQICFPTCQVRVSRFYQIYLPLLLLLPPSGPQLPAPDHSRHCQISTARSGGCIASSGRCGVAWTRCHIASSGGCGVALDPNTCQRDCQRECRMSEYIMYFRFQIECHDRMSDRMPDKMSEEMPERMSEYNADRKPE